MKTVDCLGDMCPIPVLRAKKELQSINKGDSLKIITDHSCVLESVTTKFKKHHVSYEEVIDGVWEIIIIKN